MNYLLLDCVGKCSQLKQLNITLQGYSLMFNAVYVLALQQYAMIFVTRTSKQIEFIEFYVWT